MIVTRFAPSPTGRLHLGHAFSAVQAYDMARRAGGRFVLRIEDIDRARCRAAFVTGIVDDLRWLGLDWDGDVVIQSRRADVHARALDRLRAERLLYPCICTRATVAQTAPHGEDGPIYPGICRENPAPTGDLAVAWRLDVARALARTGPLTWTDAVGGPVAADPMAGGDVVLARKGLGIAYHLAAVVDDAAAGVTDVVRGRDLIAATPVQRLLQALLDLPSPTYRHHPLVLDGDGRRLAKRTPGATLADLRTAAFDPARLVDDLRNACLPVGFALDAP